MLNEIDLSRADLNLLVLFEAVMRERNVGRAAARLNLTPSAVSHGLGASGVCSNAPLLLRTPKGMVPTGAGGGAGRADRRHPRSCAWRGSDGRRFDPATLRAAFSSAHRTPSRRCSRGRSSRRSSEGARRRHRHLLVGRGRTIERAWEGLLPTLEAREIDIAILPVDEVPARFEARVLWCEDFVVVSREGHAFARDPSLDHFCALRHLLVSQSADFFGFVDVALEKVGRARRVLVTMPSFMMGLATLEESDLIGAMPRRLSTA